MKRAFPTRLYLWALGGIILYALSPFLAGMLAEGVAALLGCNLHVVPYDRCEVLGQDVRSTLYAIGMLAWQAPLTLTEGALGLVVWVLVLVLHLIWRRFRRVQ